MNALSKLFRLRYYKCRNSVSYTMLQSGFSAEDRK